MNAEPNLEELNLADNQFEGIILPYPSSAMTQIISLDFSGNSVRIRTIVDLALTASVHWSAAHRRLVGRRGTEVLCGSR